MASDRFGRYEILAEVGDGSMARVYSAWDPAFGRVVALKTVKAEYSTGANAAAYLARFRREARAAGAISHPGIVRVFDVGPDFMVMEFVKGRTLQELLRERHRLPPEEALRLLVPIAEAVDYAHRAGIVHRDIKPANIMVQPDGAPKLMDFGIAHVEASIMTAAGEILGSPAYMAPEQVTGADVTPSWDNWSLAVLAYELLTGRTPFQGPITQVLYKVLNEQSLPPSEWNAALPPWYDDVFARALDKLPENRYATAVDLVAALDPRRLALDALVQGTRVPPTRTPPGGALDARATTQWLAPRRPAARGLRALGLGVASGLLLAMASSAGERDAPTETTVAQARVSPPAVSVSAVAHVSSAESWDAEALARFASDAGVSVVATLEPDPVETIVARAFAQLPSGPGAGSAATLTPTEEPVSQPVLARPAGRTRRRPPAGTALRTRPASLPTALVLQVRALPVPQPRTSRLAP